MKLAPSTWTGSALRLIDDVLRPHFLPASKIETFKGVMVRRLADPEALFVVGAPKPEMRARWGQDKIDLTNDNSRVVFSDRAPASAISTYMMEASATTAEKMAALLMHLPTHTFDLDKFTKWATLTNNLASAGWMTAHIFSGWTANPDWEKHSQNDLRKRTILNLHPLNLFIFPNLNKSGTVYADDPRFHALMAAEYKKIYGGLFEEFLQLTGTDISHLPAAEDFEIDFSAAGSTPASVKIDNKELVQKIEAAGAFDLKLVTINESQGYHARTIEPSLLTRGFFDVKLEYKEKAGETKTIGFFRLNLKELYEKKFLGRDAKGLRLMIYKTDSGYAVGPKKSGPLAQLPN